MVSKCANPECSKKFLHLHEGKIFHLSPTPEVEAAGKGFVPALYERFWLCDQCCQRMTLVWDGTAVKLVPVPRAKGAHPGNTEAPNSDRPKRNAASAGLRWR